MDTKNKILIAEDNQELLKLYEDIFTDAGFIVKTCTNGKQALAMVTSFMPDVLLLDLVIPEISGFELLKLIKADEKTKNIKIIILSNAYVDRADFIQHGASDVLLKTEYNSDQLIHKVREVLG